MTENLLINRVWAMPNKWTFTIKPIRELLSRYVIPSEMWIDPFCGKNSPATITNDLNPDVKADFNMDALEFLRSQTGAFDGCLYDPPYSTRQAAECYKSYGKDNLAVSVVSMKYWSSVKDELARLTKPEGIVICFGWSSMGLGKSRGFQMIEILMVPHGGSRNDTIVTVERKIGEL